MDNVETATAPTTFSVMSFIQETAYPEGVVTIYTDVVAAKELLRLNARRAELEKTSLEEAEKLSPQIAQMVERAEKSALTFNLRGFAPGVVQQIIDKYKNEENENAADAELVAKSIITVKNAEGAVDEHFWTADEVNMLRGRIAEGQWLKLLAAVADVLFNAAVFDKTVDAGFLGGRTDVAA